MTIKQETMIHPTAIIEEGAILEEGVQVGPFCYIQKNVRIGSGTVVKERVSIEGNTTIGSDNVIFAGAVIGSLTQDKKYKGGKTFLKIGSRNQIREYVTINPGTEEGTETVIGDDNLLMAYAHVAHDCIVQNYVTLANNATLAGHVLVQDHAIIGGLSAVHQFVRIGESAIVGGCSKVVQDVPSFMMVDGHPVKAFGVNSVGMERRGFASDEKSAIKKAFKLLFRSKLNLKNAIIQLKAELSYSKSVLSLIEFLEKTERGICR